jgi:hypothetical protein
MFIEGKDSTIMISHQPQFIDHLLIAMSAISETGVSLFDISQMKVFFHHFFIFFFLFI